MGVSESPWDSLAGQVADAIAFLKKHKRTSPQFESFPPALISLAGALGCGLEVSIYHQDLEELARSRQKPPRTRSDTSRRRGRDGA